jgi:uncharacterized membrane protein
LAFLALFIVVSQFWYIYSAGGSVFYNAVNSLNFIVGGLNTEFLASNTTGAGVITAATTSPLYTVAKDLYLIVESLILVGIIALLAKKTRMRFDREYAALAVATLCLLMVVLVVPFVAGFLNTSRFFQIGLIFLAPFAAIGGLAIVRAASRVIRVPCKSKCENSFLKAFSIFLAIFLMFTSGFVYAVVSPAVSTAVPLTPTLDAPRFNDLEVAGASWLSNTKNSSTLVYADAYRELLLYSLFYPTAVGFPYNQSLAAGAYVYLGTLNIQQNKITGVTYTTGEGTSVHTSASVFTSGRSRLYDNGGAQVYS